jgi:hypothetical protein
MSLASLSSRRDRPVVPSPRPEVDDVIAEMQMRRVADEFPDRVLIGEVYLPLNRKFSKFKKGGWGWGRYPHGTTRSRITRFAMTLTGAGRPAEARGFDFPRRASLLTLTYNAARFVLDMRSLFAVCG